MSARRLLALALTCAALAGAGLAARGGVGAATAARTSAPRAGSGDGVRTGAVTLAAAQQPAEPQGAGESAPRDTAARRLAYATALPDSAGRGIAERWCVLCHSAMLITQQAKDSTAWEKTLAQMEKWGVAMTPEEHDTLRTYLVRSFGPRVKAAPARAAPPVSAASDTARAPQAPR